MYLMDLIARLYGERDCFHLIDVWVPLYYIEAITGRLFNCAAIISNQLNCNIERAQKEKSKLRVVSTLYMAYYL